MYFCWKASDLITDFDSFLAYLPEDAREKFLSFPDGNASIEHGEMIAFAVGTFQREFVRLARREAQSRSVLTH